MSVDGGLRKIFREKLPDIDWVSVETGGTGRGVPDSNGCAQGQEFWAEYKLTGAWSVRLSPEQVGWITRRIRHGGSVFITVRRKTKAGPRKGEPVDELYIYTGSVARELKDLGIRKGPEPLAKFEGGPSKWNWDQIRIILLSPQRIHKI